MPYSLIILENHFDLSAYQFLYDNAENLYALGYSQMLFELYCEHEPSVYMNRLRNHFTGKQQFAEAQSVEMILKVYDKFCALGFMCRFIDPEPEHIALSYNRRLEKAFHEGDARQMDLVSSERTEATRQRDFVMATAILEANKCSRAEGGVIFVGGFLHNNLIKQLDVHSACTQHVFRYAVFHGKPFYRAETTATQESEWDAIRSASYRANFYGTDAVQDINPDQYTFEMVKAILQLSPPIPCLEHVPSVSAQLREKTGLSFQFSKDEQHVVSAHLKIRASEEERITKKIKKAIPGLQFFNRQIPGTDDLDLCIPGTNLIDQRSCFSSF